MRRFLVFGCVAVLLLGVAAPGAAKQGDGESVKESYSIPEDLAEIEEEDLGQLNHGCPTGLYTLVDGKWKTDSTSTYSPTKEAFEDGDLGATLTVSGVNQYSGLWAVEGDDSARFKLKDNNNLRFEFVFGSNGDELSQSIDWQGEFVDADTGVTVEWWNYDFTATPVGMSGIAEGSCS